MITFSIIVEHVLRDMDPDVLWIDILLNGEYANSVGPFKTRKDRHEALDKLRTDLLSLAEFTI